MLFFVCFGKMVAGQKLFFFVVERSKGNLVPEVLPLPTAV